MKKMRIMFAAAVAGVATMAGAAHAEDAKLSLSGNVALATDYTFRGISQTNGSSAIQGGFDAGYGTFYAGAWASNVAFGGSQELDLYAGVKPVVGPVTLDFGVIGYLYPNSADDSAETDYYEGYAKASIAPSKTVTLGVAGYYSPDFTLETDKAYYLEANGAVAVSDKLSLSAAYGYQKIDDVNGPSAGKLDDSYSTWNVGGTLTVKGFGLDLRYVDTSISKSDKIVTSGFATEQNANGRVILTIKRAL
jgi:uncharacterized protein (TIGR02001 family)